MNTNDQKIKIAKLNEILANSNNILSSTPDNKKQKQKSDKPAPKKSVKFGAPLKINVSEKSKTNKKPKQNNNIRVEQLTVKRAIPNKVVKKKDINTEHKKDCECAIHKSHMYEHINNIIALLGQLDSSFSNKDWNQIDKLYDNILSELNCADSSFLLSYIPTFIRFQEKVNSRDSNVLHKISEKQKQIMEELLLK